MIKMAFHLTFYALHFYYYYFYFSQVLCLAGEIKQLSRINAKLFAVLSLEGSEHFGGALQTRLRRGRSLRREA